MKGKLYGIGTGPGDPELLTIKAVNTIKKCDVIAAPKTGSGEGVALSVIEGYIGGKELIECRFFMDRDIKKRRESRQNVAAEITRFLECGKDVGFVTLGDPTTYSTYMYVHGIIVGKRFNAVIIPGVTSYSAAAAALGIALCEGDETLTLIPAMHNDSIDELLEYPGNKVVMKSGENLSCVLRKLRERGYGDKTKIAYRATLDGQQLFNSINEFENCNMQIQPGYFTLAIVKN